MKHMIDIRSFANSNNLFSFLFLISSYLCLNCLLRFLSPIYVSIFCFLRVYNEFSSTLARVILLAVTATLWSFLGDSECKKTHGGDGTSSEGNHALDRTFKCDFETLTSALGIPVVSLKDSSLLDSDDCLVVVGLLIPFYLSKDGYLSICWFNIASEVRVVTLVVIN